MTDTNKLKELAERATPGPWTTDAAQSVIADSDQLNSGWVICECFGSDEKANRNFIKAANPAAVLELIAEVEKLRADTSSMRGSLNAYSKSTKKLVKDGTRAAKERDRLKAENEALRKDAERYRWLRANNYDIGSYHPVHEHNSSAWFEYLEDFDIDAALEGGGR